MLEAFGLDGEGTICKVVNTLVKFSGAVAAQLENYDFDKLIYKVSGKKKKKDSLTKGSNWQKNLKLIIANNLKITKKKFGSPNSKLIILYPPSFQKRKRG